jgi:electron transport complex protein RnfA
MNNIASLAVISGFSLNLVLQTGLGISQIFDDYKAPLRSKLFNWFNVFLSIFILWVLWTFAISPLRLGFFQYFLLFPLIVLLFSLIESLFLRLFPGLVEKKEAFSSSSYYSLAIAAFLMMSFMAEGPVEALVLAFCFSAGGLFAVVITRAVRKRTLNEKISEKFRGMPLMLISLGLLSLVFTAVAFVLLLH